MKIITINLPEKYLSAIQTLTDMGIYPSRSEAIRIALQEFLGAEFRFFSELDIANFRMIKRTERNLKMSEVNNYKNSYS